MKWFLVPSSDGQELASLDVSAIRGVAYAIATAFVLLVSVSLSHQVETAHREYRRGISEIAEFAPDGEYAPKREPRRDLEPAEVLSERLLTSERSLSMLRQAIGESAGSTLSPEELWRQSELPAGVRSEAYFRLALVSGDLRSSFRIARYTEFGDEDHYRWHQLLTATIWQTAIESLVEADFRRALPFAQIYVKVLDQIAKAATGEVYEQGPERNRTLARMLVREFENERIWGVCSDLKEAQFFGRLLGGSWGYGLDDGASTSQIKRAARNRAEQCPGRETTQVPGYHALTVADQFLGASESSERDAADSAVATFAALFPDEFAMLSGRASLLGIGVPYDDVSLRHAADAGAKTLLDLAARPSYLADDALNEVLQNATGLTLAAGTLDKAVAVAMRVKGDKALDIETRVSQLDCETVAWAGFHVTDADSDAVRQLRENCGSSR
ncbi:MAG: hypothetical protein WA208_08025 [Thermoanaerobaculia bacterium]